MVHWNVRYHGPRRRTLVLQARHEVSAESSVLKPGLSAFHLAYKLGLCRKPSPVWRLEERKQITRNYTLAFIHLHLHKVSPLQPRQCELRSDSSRNVNQDMH